MKKNILIAVLACAVVVLGGLVWNNAQTKHEDKVIQGVPVVSQQTFVSDDSFLVPELNLKFKKVAGLTLGYTVKGKSVYFTSQEIANALKSDSGLSYCVSNLPHITLSTISIATSEFKGYDQKPLGDGQYLNVYGPQSVCYTDTTTQADKNLVMHQLNDLFPLFVNSVQLATQ